MKIANHLSYDPLTGEFIWFNPKGTKTKPGSKAGTVTTKGYIAIFFDGKPYKAHRLAFFFMEGELPENEVDHRDGKKTNNKWINLRKCSRVENQQNLKLYKNNSIGHQGIEQACSKFRAKVTASGIVYRSGLFETLEEAVEERKRLKKIHHKFSPSHREN